MYSLLEALFFIRPITFQGATNINDIKIVSAKLTQYDQHIQKMVLKIHELMFLKVLEI